MCLVCGATPANGDPALSDPRWATAMQLQASAQHDAAAQVLQALYDDYPASQPVATRLAMNLFEAGRYDQSHTVADQAISLNAYAEGWAELGYLYKARACRELGCLGETLTAIDILKKRFPDSVATTRAEVLEAEIDGIAGGVSGSDVDEEYAADQLVTQALRAARNKDYAQAITLLDDVIVNYAHTRRSLYAMERKAYILSMQPEDTADCANTFLDIIAAVRNNAPNSRIRYDAEFRVAALYQRQDMPYEAMVAYLDLADTAEDPRMAARAAFEAMGAHNEMLQRRLTLGESVTNDDWEALRNHCAEVKQRPDATALFISRADLIIAESYHWQLRTEDALSAANAHISTHGAGSDRPALATAHLIAGECLQRKGNHQEALEHYQWIIDTFGSREPWGYVKGDLGRPRYPTSLARVHYRICDPGGLDLTSRFQHDLMGRVLATQTMSPPLPQVMMRYRVKASAGAAAFLLPAPSSSDRVRRGGKRPISLAILSRKSLIRLVRKASRIIRQR